ncbi:hypothetical protein [Streptomyces sp. NPDC055085]
MDEKKTAVVPAGAVTFEGMAVHEDAEGYLYVVRASQRTYLRRGGGLRVRTADVRTEADRIVSARDGRPIRLPDVRSVGARRQPADSGGLVERENQLYVEDTPVLIDRLHLVGQSPSGLYMTVESGSEAGMYRLTAAGRGRVDIAEAAWQPRRGRRPARLVLRGTSTPLVRGERLVPVPPAAEVPARARVVADDEVPPSVAARDEALPADAAGGVVQKGDQQPRAVAAVDGDVPLTCGTCFDDLALAAPERKTAAAEEGAAREARTFAAPFPWRCPAFSQIPHKSGPFFEKGCVNGTGCPLCGTRLVEVENDRDLPLPQQRTQWLAACWAGGVPQGNNVFCYAAAAATAACAKRTPTTLDDAVRLFLTSAAYKGKADAYVREYDLAAARVSGAPTTEAVHEEMRRTPLGLAAWTSQAQVVGFPVLPEAVTKTVLYGTYLTADQYIRMIKGNHLVLVGDHMHWRVVFGYEPAGGSVAQDMLWYYDPATDTDISASAEAFSASNSGQADTIIV